MPSPARRKRQGAASKRKGKTGGGQTRKTPEPGPQSGSPPMIGDTGEQDILP